MNRSLSWVIAWALISTLLLVVAVGWPDATRTVVDTVGQNIRPRVAQAQSLDAPAQLEWMGWQHFRLTSLTGKVILFNPWLNDPAAAFSNRESPLKFDDINLAHLIVISSGHGDDQGNAAEISRKTGAPIVTAFELSPWLIARGVESAKILRSQPGSRWKVEGIGVQVVNAIHGSGAAAPPGQMSVYGGPALGFIITLENGVKVYHAGSSALTLDMQLYGRLYKPHVALLPIGSGMYPEEAAIAAEFLMTDNPNLHSVFPQHHASTLPAELQAPAFVKAVRDRRLRRDVTPFDPRPGQVFLVTGSGTRPR
jgi:L-ascorbate metabolism protein UlaG (beta-lactamase superfamily)